VVYTIAADQAYKGQVSPNQEVVTSGDEASCGIALPLGDSVLIFATGGPSHINGTPESGQLATNLCSASGPGITVPVGFGSGEPPTGADQVREGVVPGDPAPSESGPDLPVVVVVLFGVLLLGLGVVYVSRQRQGPEGD
jgi:hypothetical protein